MDRLGMAFAPMLVCCAHFAKNMAEIDGPVKQRKRSPLTYRLALLVRGKVAATLTEYAFIIAIVSIAAVVLLTAIGSATHALLEQTNSNMPQ